MNIELFNKFVYNNNGYIRLILSPYSLTEEETQQELLYTYFVNPKVEKLLVSGNENKAFTLFASKLRRNSLVMFGNSLGTCSYNALNKSIDKMISTSSMEEDAQEELTEFLYKKFLVEEIKERFREEFDFLLTYYEYGCKFTALKYNISENACRQKANRYRNKIKDGVM